MGCAHTCGSIVSFLVCLCAHGSPNIHVNLAMIVVGEMFWAGPNAWKKAVLYCVALLNGLKLRNVF